MLHEYDADPQHLRLVVADTWKLFAVRACVRRIRSRRIYRRLIWYDAYTYIKTFNYYKLSF